MMTFSRIRILYPLFLFVLFFVGTLTVSAGTLTTNSTISGGVGAVILEGGNAMNPYTGPGRVTVSQCEALCNGGEYNYCSYLHQVVSFVPPPLLPSAGSVSYANICQGFTNGTLVSQSPISECTFGGVNCWSAFGSYVSQNSQYWAFATPPPLPPANNPPAAPTITVPPAPLYIWTPHNFIFTSVDPENNQVYFEIDLNNDGIFNGGDISTLLPSGRTNSGSYFGYQLSWSTGGQKTIRVRAVDTSEARSDWTSAIFTIAADVPVVSTGVTSNVTTNSATLRGTVVAPNAPSASASFRMSTQNLGQCSSWGTQGSPVNVTTVSTPYSVSIGGLTPLTTYYVCAFATNGNGSGYGTTTLFATLNTSPVASISFPAPNTTVNEGSSVTFSGSATDADGHLITTYEWKDGSCNTGTPLSSASGFSTTALTPGLHTVSFRAFDGNLWSNCASVAITINTPPTANAGPDQSTQSTIAQPSGATATDADGSIVTRQWTKVSGPSSELITNSTMLTPTFNNLSPGTYTFRLTATDNNGAVATDDMNVIVTSPPSIIGPTVSAITLVGAVLGGTVESDGGSPLLARGTCWRIGATPESCLDEGGTGTGSFNHTRNGMTQGNTITVRAYARNSIGTSYTPDSTFNIPNGAITAGIISMDGGGTTTISWSSTNATTCTVDSQENHNTDSWTGLSGNYVTSRLGADTTYILTCNGLLISAVFIDVDNTPELSPIRSLINPGESSGVIWNSRNGNEGLCILEGGNLGPNTYIPAEGNPNTGSMPMPITARTTFTVRCPNLLNPDDPNAWMSDEATIEIEKRGFES